MTEPARSVKTELLAGVTTFLTMSYIIVVNPGLLARPETGLTFAAVMTATILAAAVPTILMGLFADLPYALAPGMGLNALFTFGIVMESGFSAGQALGAIVVSGAFLTALSLTPARSALARAIPPPLRSAAAAGIGLFLTFIGLKNAGVVVPSPATFVAPGPLTPEVGLFAGGLLLTVLLIHLRVRGALLVGMVATTLAAAAFGRVAAPESLATAPDFSLLGAFDLGGIWTAAIVAPLITLVLTDLFDSLSTFLGVAQAAGLVDDRGEPVRLGRALIVDGFATLFSGLVGSSPSTTYIESAAGVREGGRTGLTAVVAGLCFLPFLFAAPLAAVVPACATAPALVVVGFYMLRAIGDVAHEDVVTAAPAFLTLVLMPLTFSITQGLVWGILTYVLLSCAVGRWREIPVALWMVAVGCAAVLVADNL
ncbi:MAG TPA: NCS2 family permease [Kofleriaceae bacterium]|nr:NCS2 family permease [Kofleriaceae bacterium]